MTKNYKICWTCRVTNIQGVHYRVTYTNIDTARFYARYYNRVYPHISHNVLSFDVPEPGEITGLHAGPIMFDD